MVLSFTFSSPPGGGRFGAAVLLKCLGIRHLKDHTAGSVIHLIDPNPSFGFDSHWVGGG